MFLICSYKLTKNRGGVTKYLVNKYSPCHHFMYQCWQSICHLWAFCFGDGPTNGHIINWKKFFTVLFWWGIGVKWCFIGMRLFSSINALLIFTHFDWFTWFDIQNPDFSNRAPGCTKFSIFDWLGKMKKSDSRNMSGGGF